MTHIKIILADDHQLFREGLRTLLELDPKYQVVDEVDNTDALITSVSIHFPELIIQDYRMPNGGTISTANRIKIQFPHIKLIILTGAQSGSLFKQLYHSKADGVLLKDVSGEYLLQAINDVLNNKRVLSPAVRDCIMTDKNKISSREFQILELIISGLSNSEVADKLQLSVKTVENHRYNLMQKLDVRNIAELIKYVHDTGLLIC